MVFDENLGEEIVPFCGAAGFTDVLVSFDKQLALYKTLGGQQNAALLLYQLIYVEV